MSTTQTLDMPTFSTSEAIRLLWQKAQREMSLPELEWLAGGIPDHIGNQALSLSEVLSGLGCLIGGDKSGSLQQTADLPHLLYNLSYQLDEISGLASIADDAGFLARRALKEYQK